MARNVVGARELKVRLGTYLRRVRQGRTLIVTDRGQPIAELRPIEVPNGAAAVLARLKATGAVTQSVAAPLPPFRQIVSGGQTAAAAILADRDDRL